MWMESLFWTQFEIPLEFFISCFIRFCLAWIEEILCDRAFYALLCIRVHVCIVVVVVVAVAREPVETVHSVDTENVCECLCVKSSIKRYTVALLNTSSTVVHLSSGLRFFAFLLKQLKNLWKRSSSEIIICIYATNFSHIFIRKSDFFLTNCTCRNTHEFPICSRTRNAHTFWIYWRFCSFLMVLHTVSSCELWAASILYGARTSARLALARGGVRVLSFAHRDRL